MKKLTTCLLVFSGISGLTTMSSCTDEPIKPKTKTELLTASAWKIKEFTVNPGIDIGGVVITDFLTQLDPCDIDDLNIYKADGNGIIDEGPTKCNPSDPQTTTFKWVFNPDETKITEDNTDTYDIIQLDETTFKTTIIADGSEIGGIAGLKYKLSVTYKH